MFFKRYAPLVLVVFLAISGFYYHGQRGLTAQDDNLWLHMLSLKISHLEQAIALETQAIDFAKEKAVSKDDVLRIEMRRDYGMNYILPVAIWNRLGMLFPAPHDMARYAEYVGAFIPGMLAFTALLSWLGFIFILVHIKRPDLTKLVVLGLSVVSAFSILALVTRSPNQQLLAHGGWKFFKTLVHFVLDPGLAFNLFGSTPRNNLAVVTLGLFLLRWSGKTKTAYIFLLPMYFIHSSMTLLLAAHLVAIDLIRQRFVLQDWRVLTVIVTGIFYGLWRETLWSSVSSSGWGKCTLIGLLLLLVVCVFVPKPFGYIGKISSTLVASLQSAYRSIISKPAPIADGILLIMIWAISMPVVFMISHNMNGDENLYFWAQIHGRSIGMLQPVLICSALYGVLLTNLARYYKHMLAFSLVIWCAGFSWQAFKKPTPIELCQSRTKEIETYLSGGPNPAFKPFDHNRALNEDVLYYAFGQMLTYGNDRWHDLKQTSERKD